MLHGGVGALVEEDPPKHSLAPSEAEENALSEVVLVLTCAANPGASLEGGRLGGASWWRSRIDTQVIEGIHELTDVLVQGGSLLLERCGPLGGLLEFPL